jgi:hypothetical protein
MLLLSISCGNNEKINWCKEGIKQAQKEIAKEGLVFVKYLTIGGGANRYDEELQKLLKASEIGFCYEAISDIEIEGDYDKRECYSKTLIKEIENKFGKDYIEKIIEKADKEFANRENFVFDYWDLDEKPFYPNLKGEKFSGEELVKYLNKHLEYPDKYKLAESVEERPFVELEFIIDEDGNPSSFKLGQSVFPKEKEKFKEYFGREVLQIISKISKWESGKIRGRKVKTKFIRRIPLDWII